MKKAICILSAICIILTLCSCSKITNTEQEVRATDTSKQKQILNSSFSSNIESIPEEYFEPIKSGAIATEMISYTHRDHNKNLIVYLPPNYNENEKYDVMYIVPGNTGDYTTYFSENGTDRKFQILLDNMITNSKIKPCIIAALSFYPKELNMDNITLDEMLEDFRSEMTDCIMPLVETKYSTYTEGSSKENLIKSRDHRAFAGCSMGGAFTWDMLATSIEYFKYYAPTAAGSFEDYYDGYNGIGHKVQTELQEKGYTTADFFIFCSNGTKDVTYQKMDTLMNRFKNDYSDVFIFTDNDISAGNITYKVLENGEHNFDYMHIYLYNALQSFWNN